MIEYSQCKINLGLQIVARREDGFHELRTIMYPISGCPDILELQRADSDLFTSSGIAIDCPIQSNLCTKALQLLRERYIIPAVHIHLHKQIPFGAGLGGGSGDAVSVMKLCNNEFDLGISNIELEELAALLGSDTSFFVRSVPQLALGRGEILKPVAVDLSPYYIYIVKPPITISTRQAYAGVSPTRPKYELEEIIRQPIDCWREVLDNDFEKSLFPEFPMLAQIKADLYARGALYASLSGSGSAVFGIFENRLATVPPHFWHAENV